MAGSQRRYVTAVEARNLVSCEALQCTAGGDCIETFRTTAEGTPCGEDMICLGAQCVPSDSVPQPVNGGWSSWTEWECSRTCGCGVLRRQRLCDNPKTQWGGAHCVGEGTENTLCNCNSCGNTPDDHRNEQCAASDDVPLDGILYSWVALFGNFIDEIFYCQNPCQTTLPTGYLRPPFENVDGTDCWDHEISDWSTLQKCVSGICQEFGCDGVQGSTKSFDSCRICNSDGSTCSQTTGSFASGTLSIFNDIVTIPEGATSVVITNNDLINGNHIAISGLTSTAFYFIGSGSSPSPNIRSWFLTMTIIHDFEGNAETFFTQGPTIEPLLIQIFLTTQITNSVNYEFYTPNAGTSYFWNVCDYGSCSVSCGGGMQSREITCDEVVGSTQTVVDDSVCASNVGTKPDTTQSCNTVECPSWVEGDFGPCSQSCDTGMQSRDVECQYDGSTVADGLCEAEKPETTQSCNEFPCDADELCCEYIRSSSGTVERTVDTEGRNCIITLIAPIGTTFELDNVDIDISCGLSESFTLIDGVDKYLQCGGSGNAPARANLKGNIIVIKFRMTGSGSFKFDFSRTSAGTRSRSCDQFIDTFSEPNQGRLRTPRFPKRYPPRSRCTMQIIAEKEKKLFLFFSRFQLQGNPRRNCKYDRLELTNLLTGSQEVFCGNLRTFTRTLDNYAQLYFKSNSRRNFRGFQVRYRVV